MKNKEFLKNVPLWIQESFKEHDYEPKNAYEANWFLNDVILELGKHKEFAVEYKKDNEEIDVAILTKDNPFDIFYTPIWKNADKITKANCINWSYNAICNFFNIEKKKLYFVYPGKYKIKNYLGLALFNGSIYLNIFDLNCKNTPAIRFLATLAHEITHIKQHKEISWMTEQNIFLGDNVKDYAAFVHSTVTNISKSEDVNKFLYTINPNEVQANNKALNFINSVFCDLLKKYGYSKDFVKDKINFMTAKFSSINNGNVRVVEQCEKLLKLDTKNTELIDFIKRYKNNIESYNEDKKNNKIDWLNCLNVSYIYCNNLLSCYKLYINNIQQLIKIAQLHEIKKKKMPIKKFNFQNIKFSKNEQNETVVTAERNDNYYSGTVPMLKREIENLKLACLDAKTNQHFLKKCVEKVLNNKTTAEENKKNIENFFK